MPTCIYCICTHYLEYVLCTLCIYTQYTYMYTHTHIYIYTCVYDIHISLSIYIYIIFIIYVCAGHQVLTTHVFQLRHSQGIVPPDDIRRRIRLTRGMLEKDILGGNPSSEDVCVSKIEIPERWLF